MEGNPTNKISENIFNQNKPYLSEEHQYLTILENILDHGFVEEGRNGKTKSLFGASMRFSLKDGKMPILTTKKTAWKTCLKELLWFISGKTNNNILKDQGVHIWDENASPSFLKSRGLGHYKDGELGPIYGHQWRHFNGPSDPSNTPNEQDPSNTNEGIDQLQEIIDILKDPIQRTSRRIIMTAWNPCQLKEMALPPCHILCQFNVHNGNQLSCCLYQRSGDFPLGIPFNIASYSFLTHLLAKHCDLEAYEFIHFIGNCHIYEEHMEPIKAQLDRGPFEFPTLTIKEKRGSIDDYLLDDFVVDGYKCWEAIKMKMVA